ncbi:hypothetical protein CKO40_10530 [Halochromatium glycolicum]|uniref:Diguanylate cyclase (GGDEF) domain-containing protein n=1 Tax=Halochromatium glycolicum TaxID=85075 RepID=A0AAJ0XAL5_9GAMM|nr:hypothetical protein [Halochromatium glycolicum]
MLVLPGVEADGAAHLAEKLVARLVEPMRLAAQTLSISCSLGISLFPADGDGASELIAHADTAMYQAKQDGRNRYQFFTEAMQREALRTMTLEHQLRQALAGGELCLRYQPQIELASGRPLGLEALLRWSHPSRGLLDAGAFVPLAENSGLIQDLGVWVLRALTISLRDRPHATATANGRRHPKQVGNINPLVIDTTDHADALQFLNERLLGNLRRCKRQRVRRQIEALVINFPISLSVR